MPYGIIKVDTITFTDAGVDKSIQISGLVQNPTFSGNVTCTGTISGVTVTGTVGAFTTVSGITVTGTTANFTSGNFINISGGTYTITSGVFASGSAASPSISFTGDSNTGLYSPGADQVAISTNGTGRLFVDASGNVGVGTSPSTTFHVAGNARIGAADANAVGVELGEGATGNRSVRIDFVGDTTYTDYGLRIIRGSGGANGDTGIIHRGTGFLRLNAEDAGVIGFNVNGSERMRLDSSGRLGLGTSSPWTTQTIYGTGVAGDLTSARQLGVGFAQNYHLAIGYYQTAAAQAYAGALQALDGGSGTRLLLNPSGGNVGIGTTSPSELLHVAGIARIGANDTSAAAIEVGAGASGNRLAYIDLTGDTTYSDYGLRIIRNNTGANAPSEIIHRGTGDLAITASEVAPISFRTSNTERARIDSSGRLLVGTSSSQAYVFVEPNFQMAGSGYANGTIGLRVENTNGNTAPGIYLARSRGSGATIVADGDRVGFINFAPADGTGYSSSAARIDCNIDGAPGAGDTPGRLVFSTTADGASSPTERMRISANGVVTIQDGAVAVIGTLTDGATITPDLAANCNFTVTLGGARTIANPTNITAGQSGSIFLVQDGTGGRTASWGSYWDFPGGTAPTLSTAANAVDRVDYIVRSSTSIHTVFTANYS